MNIVKHTTFLLDIEDIIWGGRIAFVIKRDATVGNANDTYGNSVVLVDYVPRAWFFKP